MKLKHDKKNISKGALIIIVSSLLLNLIVINVNAQITWQRDLVFGKFTSYGPGHITISGDNNSTVTTDGQVVALPGVNPQSANLHVVFDGTYLYNSVNITYDAGEVFTNGSSNLAFAPSPNNGVNYHNPGWRFLNNTLDIYLGGTLTVGTGMIGGTYTDAIIRVYCNFSYQ
jgi:hypothetical protein